MTETTVSVQEILAAELADWRKLAQGLHARFLTGDHATGLRFAAAVAATGDAPDLRLTREYVDLTLLRGQVVFGVDDGKELVGYGVTRRELEQAARISEVARELGITADPSAVVQLELAIDTAGLACLGPFWAAVLTGRADALLHGEVFDPDRRVPTLWFQPTEPHEEPRQRFHLDLWLPHDVAPDRIAAAVVAGGRVVDDSGAPSYVVLADPEGNKVCVCTCLER